MKKIFTPLFFICVSISLQAQDAFLKGTLSDSKTKETIVGASVIVDDTTGTVTDINGNYFFKTTVGKHKIEFKSIDFKAQVLAVELNANDTLSNTIVLENDSKTLGIVVVSAGKFEQNLSEVTVSMEVLKPSLVESKSIQTIETAVDQVPGVNVIDGQANIRGGAGFSYGAGSRVLVMVDEMPMLTADAGDVKWTFLPVENCEQIEVIKGASSALFGSSAMNGVINFRTAYAKEEPETKISFYGGVYQRPKRDSMAWWWGDTNPTYSGVNFCHSQKIKQFDIVVAGNLYDDDGYRYLETEQRYRANANLRYRFKGKLQGLQVGVNANTIRTKGGLFLIWENADSGAYRPTGGDLSHYTTYRSNVDPFLTYYTTHDSKHTLRGRFFRTINKNNTDQESTADVYYSEYQFQKRFQKGLTATIGGVYNYNEVRSGPLYGNHYSNNSSLFIQLDQKWKRLNISLGAREEYFKTDSVSTEENLRIFPKLTGLNVARSKFKPVFRGGINYRVLKATNVRASYGQGFRFPTVAEKYIKTSASGLNIFPNDSLRPEYGWSAEIGIKQGLRLGQWRGYFDVAAYWTEYSRMMEFKFGNYDPTQPNPYDQLGFQSQNIGNTRISGIDISLMGGGKVGKVDVNTFVGYTYVDAIQTDFDYNRDSPHSTTHNALLKYRYNHTWKGDLELGYKKFTTGMGMRANSYMENIDAYFEVFFAGLADYRRKHRGGDWIFDYRLSYQITKTARLSFIVNNIFNREVMGRPMDIQPPRVVALQLTLKF